MTEPKKKPGRPAGSKTKPAQRAERPLLRCEECDSTQVKVLRTTEREIHGTNKDGKPHTHVRWQRCQCQDCQNVIVCHSFHNKVGKRKTGK